MAHILVVDDEDRMRHLLSIILRQAGHQVEQAVDGEEALSKVQEVPFDMVISDIKMPRMSGDEMLQRIKDEEIPCPVVFITAFATVDSAVEAMRMGAADYITKPFDHERILLTVERTLNLSRVLAENRALREKLVKASENDRIVCVSDAMKQVVTMAKKVAASESAVLIQGESGTGKELMARYIHNQSMRKNERFVPINCAAISPQLLESELFGYEKGAFTGADRRTQGKFEYADRGSLFMDEVGDLSLDAQAKLLRALQEKKVMRVGGNREIDVDVRIICATNRNLKTLVDNNEFRNDLFFRINVFPIEPPPLRDRKEDVVPLCKYFLQKLADGKEISLTEGAIRILMEYPWPGNVRELANAVERALIFSTDHGGITAETLSFLRPGAPYYGERNGAGFRLPSEGISLEELQLDFARQALEITDNNQTKAAKMLGLTRAKFRVLLKHVSNS